LPDSKIEDSGPQIHASSTSLVGEYSPRKNAEEQGKQLTVSALENSWQLRKMGTLERASVSRAHLLKECKANLPRARRRKKLPGKKACAEGAEDGNSKFVHSKRKRDTRHRKREILERKFIGKSSCEDKRSSQAVPRAGT